jgi:DNA-binding NtrC family response regulator
MATVPRRIFVVDGDTTVREVQTSFMDKAYEVSSATTAADALMKVRRKPIGEPTLDARHRLLAQRPRGIEQTSRLLTVKDLKVRVVAVGQPGEVPTTLTVAGYLLPENGNKP